MKLKYIIVVLECQMTYQRFSHCCWVHAPAVGLLVPCIVVSASALTLFIRFIFEMYSSEIIKQRSLSGIGFWLSCFRPSELLVLKDF